MTTACSSTAACSVYPRSFVEVYVHRLCAASAFINFIDWGQMEKCLLLVTLLKIPTKDLNNLLNRPFFILMGAKTIKLPQCLHKDFLSESFQESIFFNPTTNGEITIITHFFVSSIATGFDNILMSIITESIRLISEPLAYILNL